MIDRLFFPALVFVVLVAATSAFAIDAVQSATPSSPQNIVQLERVVIIVKRETAAPTIASAEAATQRPTALR